MAKMLARLLNCFIIIQLSFRSANSSSSSSSSRSRSRVPALYVFGDSLVENGNNNHLLTVAKADYFPYGVDFWKGPTGRFTNGRTIADFTSENLGLPYSPSFMNAFQPNWLTGFNYASAACGILEESGKLLGECYDLDEQIQMFKDTIEMVLKRHYTNREDLSNHLANSILLFVIGNNDYLINYFPQTKIPGKKMNPGEFAINLLNRLSEQLQSLYKLGARKVIFSEIGPVGCMPFVTKATLHKGQCNEKYKDIVSMFNKGLDPLFFNLTSELQGSQFLLVKVHNLFLDIVNHPYNYGFENGRDACCKAQIGGIAKCIREHQPCIDHKKHCFWDAFHPTEAMNELIYSRCRTDNSICDQKLLQLLKS